MTKRQAAALVRDLSTRPSDFLAKFISDAKKNGVDNPTYEQLTASLNRLYNGGYISTSAVLLIGIYAWNELPRESEENDL